MDSETKNLMLTSLEELLGIRAQLKVLQSRETLLKDFLKTSLKEQNTETEGFTTFEGLYSVTRQERKTAIYDDDRVRNMLKSEGFWEAVQMVDMGKVKKLVAGKNPLIHKSLLESCIGDHKSIYALVIKKEKLEIEE